MARNLQSKLTPDDIVWLYDINKAAAERLAAETAEEQPHGAKAEVKETVQEAAQFADTIISCLPEPEHVKSTYQSLIPVFQSNTRKQPRLAIDCSTIDPASSRAMADSFYKTLGKNNACFVDAPMSGGVVGASAGTLTFMLGAPDSIVPLTEPVLLRMGKRVLHCGPQGSGLAAKLANNYLLAIQNIAAAEAMNMGVKMGLQPKVLADVINVSTGRCWATEVNNPVPDVVPTAPASRDYQGGFGIGLMRKDLRLAVQAANEEDAKLCLAQRAVEVYKEAESQERCKGRDFSVVYRWLAGE